MFDLIYYQINLSAGVESTTLPGVFAYLPPKRSARGREKDKIFGFLKISNPQSVSPELLQQWIDAAVTIFYRTPGTVTAAMRMVTDTLNNRIMDRNLHGDDSGKPQITASLNLAVEHHDFLYYTTLGSARTFLIQPSEVITTLDNDATGKGLGTSKLFIPRFQQAELAAGDLLIFGTNPPASWNAATLAGSTLLSTDALRRRLFNQIGSELQAVVFKLAEGNGKIEQRSFRPLASETRQSVPLAPSAPEKSTPVLEAAPKNVPEKTAVEEPPVSSLPVTIEKSLAGQVDVTPQVQQHDLRSVTSPPGNTPGQRQPQAAQPIAPHGVTSMSAGTSAQAHKAPPTRPQQPSGTSEFTQGAAEFWEKTQKTKSTVKNWLHKALLWIFPGASEVSPQLSRSLMLIISIAVPLIVVAVGITVYNRMGRTAEVEAYLGQAELSVTQAESQAGDANAQLSSLQQAMFWIEKAEAAGPSDEVAQLKAQIQSRLDSMSGILRLQLSSALGEALPESVNITRLVTVGNDLYALDSKSGKALHFILSGGIYQKDVNFDCGPNSSLSTGTIGPLVDITPLESGAQFGATILGIDAAGMLEYCIPSDTGNITQLALPDAGWGRIQAVILSQGNLYVLDTKGNAVYLYEGSGIDFPDKPILFFDNQVPNLTEALDTAVNGDELYILRSNGEMVECTYSYLKALKPTQCQDPASYGDMRTGQLSQTTVFMNTQFTQMVLTQAPDSSVYLLDSAGKTIYHFSLQRNLQNVYHPTLGDGLDIERLTPTAFTVSSTRKLFIAFGNEIQSILLP